MSSKKYKKSLAAHELGHAIFSYLYDTDETPTSMSLVPDGYTMGCVNFATEPGLPVADGSVAKIKSSSYLGGMFGELIYHGRFRTMGVRTDMDEFLTGLRFVKNGSDGTGGNRYRRSRSKIFRELWAWFYTDKDRLSYGGMMKRWADCPRGVDGTQFTLTQFKKRLPVTAAVFEKFLSHIDATMFNTVVDEIVETKRTNIPARSLRKMARRIIPDTVMHPEDI